VRLVALAHPAHDYRAAVRAGAEGATRPDPRSCWVVVYRGPERLRSVDVEASAYALLGELARSVPLGEACERVADATPERHAFEAMLAAWFQEWTALGLVSRLG
jgi:hypothetical protein